MCYKSQTLTLIINAIYQTLKCACPSPNHLGIFVKGLGWFGYVYLEALARGCFCLGTWNTGLPDVADHSSSMQIPAAQPAELAQALISLESRAFEQGFNREEIAASVARWSWSRFRNDVVVATQHHLLQSQETS